MLALQLRKKKSTSATRDQIHTRTEKEKDHHKGVIITLAWDTYSDY